MNKNHILKHAEKSEFLGDSLCLASFMKHIVIGRTEMTPDSQTVFDDNKSVTVKSNQYMAFCQSLAKAKYYYENKPTESFEIEIAPPGRKKNSLYPLFACFGPYEDQPKFQLR